MWCRWIPLSGLSLHHHQHRPVTNQARLGFVSLAHVVDACGSPCVAVQTGSACSTIRCVLFLVLLVLVAADDEQAKTDGSICFLLVDRTPAGTRAVRQHT